MLNLLQILGHVILYKSTKQTKKKTKFEYFNFSLETIQTVFKISLISYRNSFARINITPCPKCDVLCITLKF